MKIRRFISESGFKVLAMARLSQAEYGVLLYLMNTAASGLDQLVTTEDELAVSLGHDRVSVHQAMRSLSDRGMIRMQFGEGAATTERASFSVSMQFEMDKWQLNFAKEATSHDAVIYPFRRHGVANFLLMEGKRKVVDSDAKVPTWQRVLDSFERGRSLDSEEQRRAEHDARILVETHPVDQILIMLRHFGTRIPTLSLLASSWSHFLEVFETETQKIDMLDARQKHHELDDRIRKAALKLMEEKEDLGLSEDEMTVLDILSQHRHPRRQLFWAWQSRSRYPRLNEFFEENSGMMLSVTSMGQVVKKHPDG